MAEATSTTKDAKPAEKSTEPKSTEPTATPESTTPEIGGENPEEFQRGGRAELDFQRAKAEKEERDAQVEYTDATYKAKEPKLLREIAEELGLTRQEDYNDLVSLNGNLPLEARIDAGEKIRLPKRYTYVGVENVTGGAVKK